MAQRAVTRKPAKEFSEGTASTQAALAQAVVPFDQASKPETEVAYQWSALKQTANSQPLGPIPLPANGYLRNVWIEIETTSEGTLGSGVVTGDYPWNLIESVKLTEPNGAPVGAELSGFNLFLANVYGAYSGSPDPRTQYGYSGTGVKPTFALRIPVEIAPNGLGALGNQSASAAFRLALTISPDTTTFSTQPTTLPTFTIRVITELWGEPPERDVLGRPCQQAPPFEGTAQYWTEYGKNSLNSGQNQTRVTRVGSMIRNLLFVYRTTATNTPRSEGPAPSTLQLQWDNRVFRTQSKYYNQQLQRELIDQIGERLTGVYLFSFSMGEQRHAGANEINAWLATLTATRLELLGNSSEAGTVDILVNDVSVTAINPLERTQQIGVGGYHPPIGESSSVTG